MDELNRICATANTGRFVAGTVFGALCNSTWTFKRVLTGKPSDGIVHGRAQFLFSLSDELIFLRFDGEIEKRRSLSTVLIFEITSGIT